MGTPLGDFIRARRDGLRPEALGLPTTSGRRRAPGLRRVELAARAGISVEYLTRIEQGRDRNPSIAVVNALADALALNPAERGHLRHLSKISGGVCTNAAPHVRPARPDVRPAVLETLRLLESGLAVLTNRLGDILAHTSGYRAVMAETGLLDAPEPNLTRYVFTDPRAKHVLADWDLIADECAFDLWFEPSGERARLLADELVAVVGEELAGRMNRHLLVPQRGVLRLQHPAGERLRFRRETLELADDGQQMVVLLPADPETADAVERLRRSEPGSIGRATAAKGSAAEEISGGSVTYPGRERVILA